MIAVIYYVSIVLYVWQQFYNIDGVCSFSFLKQPCMRHIMAIFQDDSVKMHQAQIVKGWLSELSKQDLDQKWMHLLMEIASQHLFPSRGAYIFGH